MTEEIIKRFRREFGEMGLDGFTQTEVEQFILQELSKAKEEVKAELREKVEGLPNATMEYVTDGGSRKVKVELKAKFTEDLLDLLK